MKKGISIILICLFMIIGLCACNSKSGEIKLSSNELVGYWIGRNNFSISFTEDNQVNYGGQVGTYSVYEDSKLLLTLNDKGLDYEYTLNEDCLILTDLSNSTVQKVYKNDSVSAQKIKEFENELEELKAKLNINGVSMVEIFETIDEAFVYTELGTENIELQYSLAKAQCNDISKEEFIIDLVEYMRIEELGKRMDLTYSELEEIYNENPDMYNVVVVDILYLDSSISLEKAKRFLAEGKSFSEIATILNGSIFPKDTIPFDYEEISDIKNSLVGDIFYLDEANAILKVIGKLESFSELWNSSHYSDDIRDKIKNQKAKEIVSTVQGYYEDTQQQISIVQQRLSEY